MIGEWARQRLRDAAQAKVRESADQLKRLAAQAAEASSGKGKEAPEQHSARQGENVEAVVGAGADDRLDGETAGEKALTHLNALIGLAAGAMSDTFSSGEKLEGWQIAAMSEAWALLRVAVPMALGTPLDRELIADAVDRRGVANG